MIKILITGIWICAVALASVYFSVQTSNKKEAPKTEHSKFEGLEKVSSDLTTIPVIDNGLVQGYFLIRITVTVEAKKLVDIPIPVPALITDVLYSALVGDQLIRFPNIKKFDLPGLKKVIIDKLNARAGKPIFHDVFIEQIDFLSKNDIRQNMRGGTMTNSGIAIVEEKAPGSPSPKAPEH